MINDNFKGINLAQARKSGSILDLVPPGKAIEDLTDSEKMAMKEAAEILVCEEMVRQGIPDIGQHRRKVIMEGQARREK